MAKRLELYKCAICGNIVEVLHGGDGELVCCKKPMKLQVANTVDAAKEKHVPMIEKSEKGIKIKVGSVAHPMEDKHYIEWIDFEIEDKVIRTFLKPGDKPEATISFSTMEVIAKAYCNLHGLWSSK